MVAKIDVDGSGEIGFDEFVQLFKDADDAKTESSGKLLRETFDMVSDTFIYFVHIICVYLILIPNF